MGSDVLLLSQRNQKQSKLVAYCVGYEFEDTVAALTGARRIDTPDVEFSRRAYKLARWACRSPGLARRIAPYPRDKIMLDNDVSLFFPIFNHPYELYALALIPNWRDRVEHAACFITEAWSDMLPEYLVELLADFDHIYLGCRNSVQDVSRITGRPCSYLPPAADVLRFAPRPGDQQRPIDISYIGRRSEITHRALVEDAGETNRFYYYDTVVASGVNFTHRSFSVDNPADHRRLLATLLKHSRYFVANRSYVNQPDYIAGRDEIATRFFEGLAAGTVMLGEAPRSEEFKRLFDWQDAVIHLPFDSPDIGRILRDLDQDQQRLATVRTANVRNAALRHDWLHRLQVVFDGFNMPHTEQMQLRATKLSELSRQDFSH